MGLNPIKPWGQVENKDPGAETKEVIEPETTGVVTEPAGWFSNADSVNSEDKVSENSVITPNTETEQSIPEDSENEVNVNEGIKMEDPELKTTEDCCTSDGVCSNPDAPKRVSDNCPPWYKAKDDSVDVMFIIQNCDMSFALGSAFKHLIKAAYDYYGDNLRKAVWYLDKEIAHNNGFNVLGAHERIDPIDVIEEFQLPYLLGKAVDTLLSYANTGDNSYLAKTVENVSVALSRNNFGK